MDLQPAPMVGLVESCDTGLSSPSSPVPMFEEPVKKATRQWAAWTRQEEENFFSALRQVGKNFEKITCRVQSKNKDQVRHYYYRLVRRMNKLLGPGFGLDAKNSKDTIAAMLRWWSLLEKYSCTSSKLHLKPRRFKTFVEALAHQLLKDRNKGRRKRLHHGENFPPIPEASATIIRSGIANESHPVTALILNGQFTQKVGSSKGGSTKGAAAANDIYSRGGSFTEKVARPRRKTNLVSSAAYKRWEKAAMAGVSLVADAAEQLEQSNNGSNNARDLVAPTILSHKHYCATGGENASFATSARQPTCNNFSEVPNQIGNAQPASKLKLQLFPVDEGTCKALEKDEHNPYLELTLSSRKRISSILEHLHRKWGSSSIASGELTLFPYSVHPDFATCRRWTMKDKSVCAGDIYLIVGSPAVFRLRYGWLVNGDLGVEVPVPLSDHSSDCSYKDGSEKASIQNSSSGGVHIDEHGPQELPPSVAENASVADASFVNEPMVIDAEDKTESSYTESHHDIQMEETNIKERCDEQEEPRLVSDVALASGWADNHADLSVGELLFESSRSAASVSVGSVGGPIDPSPEQVPFSSDSFDAVIAAHVSGYKEQSDSPYQIPQSSFWDAEETCDGFSFRTVPSSERSGSSDFLSTGFSKQNFQEDATGFSKQNFQEDVSFHGLLKSTKIEPSDYNTAEKEMEPEPRSSKGCNTDNPNAEKSLGLADIFWPDSLGALDLDIPPSRYVADDLFYGDSISLGLSRLMASSLDAFQNVSLFSFSLDKRESSK